MAMRDPPVRSPPARRLRNSSEAENSAIAPGSGGRRKKPPHRRAAAAREEWAPPGRRAQSSSRPSIACLPRAAPARPRLTARHDDYRCSRNTGPARETGRNRTSEGEARPTRKWFKAPARGTAGPRRVRRRRRNFERPPDPTVNDREVLPPGGPLPWTWTRTPPRGAQEMRPRSWRGSKDEL